MPAIVLAAGVPARDVDIVHAAIVKRRAFWAMAFGGHQARRLVRNTNDRQVADLAVRDEALDGMVIPGTAIEHVHSHQPIASLDLLQELPFLAQRRGERFFCDHMLASIQRSTQQYRAYVGERENTDHIERGIAK